MIKFRSPCLLIICFSNGEIETLRDTGRFTFPSRKSETVRAPMAAAFLDLESLDAMVDVERGTMGDTRSWKLPVDVIYAG